MTSIVNRFGREKRIKDDMNNSILSPGPGHYEIKK